MKVDERRESRLDKVLKQLVGLHQLSPDSPISGSARFFANQGHRRLGLRKSWAMGAKRFLKLFIPITIALMLVLGTFLWYTQDNSWRSPSSSPGGGFRAVLVDELSQTVPDPSFTSVARSALTSVGYTVDYYGPGDVTVGFLQDLPLKGYDVVIIRAHSGTSSIYTSEPYSTSRYVLEQLADQVIPVQVDGRVLFAITQKFVRDNMHGKFPGSVIITMGCSGLAGPDMAQAFLDRGARAYVGWDRAVSSRHTDRSIAALLQWLAQGKTVREAVSVTTDKVGPDPVYQSRLGYYDSAIAPRQSFSQSLLGLSALALLLLFFMISGPFVVVLIPRLLSRT